MFNNLIILGFDINLFPFTTQHLVAYISRISQLLTIFKYYHSGITFNYKRNYLRK